jgi:hypothetical protein
MDITRIGTPPLTGRQPGLERQYITAYLAAAGLDYHALLERNDREARRLLAEAALYASEKLSEIESRSRLLRTLHGER